MTNNSINLIDKDKLWLLEFLRNCTIHYEPSNSLEAKELVKELRKAFDNAIQKSDSELNDCS